MSDLKLTKTGMTAGKWEGLLTGASEGSAPKICVMLYDQILQEIEPEPLDGQDSWHVTFNIKPDYLSEGVQTFLFVAADTKETLTRFSMVSGDVLADDLRAEIDLLRAELDMFKRVFRQHCIETM